MTPRSPKRLASKKRSPTTRKKKATKPAGFNVYCYRVASGMTLSFFPLRAEAISFCEDRALPVDSISKITVRDNKELAAVLQSHTL